MVECLLLALFFGITLYISDRNQALLLDEVRRNLPEPEQMELVNLIWDAPEAEVLSLGEVFQFERDWLPEVMGFVPCAACGELTARAYRRVLGEKHLCIPCAGYER